MQLNVIKPAQQALLGDVKRFGGTSAKRKTGTRECVCGQFLPMSDFFP